MGSESLKRKRGVTSKQRMSMQLQHLTGSLGFMSMQALQLQVEGLAADVQALSNVFTGSRQGAVGRQHSTSNAAATLQYAGSRGRAASSDDPNLHAVPENQSGTARSHTGFHARTHAGPQTSGGVNSSSIRRQTPGAGADIVQGTGARPLLMMPTSPTQTSTHARVHSGPQQQIQPQRCFENTLLGQCVGAPVSAEASTFSITLERTEEQRQFQSRTLERVLARRAARATTVDDSMHVASSTQEMPRGMQRALRQDPSAHNVTADTQMQQYAETRIEENVVDDNRPPVGQQSDAEALRNISAPEGDGGLHMRSTGQLSRETSGVQAMQSDSAAHAAQCATAASLANEQGHGAGVCTCLHSFKGIARHVFAP